MQTGITSAYSCYPRIWRGSKWLECDDPESLPALPGCYVIFNHDQVLYVGESVNLRARFCHYRFADVFGGEWGLNDRSIGSRGRREFVIDGNLRIKIRLADKYGDWLMREARLIRRLRPLLNIKGIPRERGSYCGYR